MTATSFVRNTFAYIKSVSKEALFLKQAATLDREKVLFQFDTPESVKSWGYGCDQDIGGYSQARIGFSDDGALKFNGTLSLALKPSSDAIYSGYVALRSRLRKRQHLFDRRTYDCSQWNYIVLNMKGDHRTYSFNFKTSRSFSGDLYMCKFKFSTPYEWERVILPIDYFHRTNCGVEYMRQHPPNMENIQSFGLLLADNLPGPFHLEIKSIEMSNLEMERQQMDNAQFQQLITKNLHDPTHKRKNWSDMREGVQSLIGFDMGNGMIESKERYARRFERKQKHLKPFDNQAPGSLHDLFSQVEEGGKQQDRQDDQKERVNGK
ncbi:hypothetical protein MP228_008734 [Amoeboaphelidium protococcarum]|nr:hypothetical protein MP228_008734 [Amoeboaphelidium protococcarum]